MRRMRHLKPREIQGCQLALDASIATSLYDATSGGSLVAANGAVARWEDQSGNARHVTQSTLGNRPLRRISSKGGMDALQKNTSTATKMVTAGFYPSSGSGDVTVVSVSAPVVGAAYSTTWQYGGNSVSGDRLAWLPIYNTSRSAVDGNGCYVGRQSSPPENSGWAMHALVASGASTIGGTSQRVNRADVTENYTLSPTTSLNIGTSIPFAVMNNDGSSLPIDYMASVATWGYALSVAVLGRLEAALMRKWRISG